MNDDEPNCWTCAYSNFPETAEPCASCDMYFSHFESTEPTESTDTTASEDARRCSLCKFRDIPIVQSPCQRCAITPGLPCFTSDTNKLVEIEMMKRGIEYPEYEEDKGDEEDVLSPCATCKYGDLPGTVGPCASCFDEGLDHPLNYEEATESEDEGCTDSGDEGSTDSGVTEIVPKHIVDMFVERVGQEVRRHFEAHNAHPRPCPYCREIPEVVEETIYPGEEHCYVVCNGAKLLPHSISIHGRTREEAVARWNSFVLTMKSQEK